MKKNKNRSDSVSADLIEVDGNNDDLQCVIADNNPQKSARKQFLVGSRKAYNSDFGVHDIMRVPKSKVRVLSGNKSSMSVKEGEA